MSIKILLLFGVFSFHFCAQVGIIPIHKDSLATEQELMLYASNKKKGDFLHIIDSKFPKNTLGALNYTFKVKYLIYIAEHLKAEKLALEGLRIAPKNSAFEARMHNSLGGVFGFTNRYTLATKEYVNAIRIFDKLELESKTAMIYSNLGNIYFTQLDYLSAEKNLKKAVFLLRKYQDSTLLSSINSIYAICLAKNKKFKLAQKEIIVSSKLANVMKNPLGITCSFNAKGELFLAENQLENAEKSFKQSLEIAEKYGIVNFVIFNRLALLNLYNQLKEYKNAIFEGETLMPYLKKTANQSTLASYYRGLSQAYNGVRNHEKAYFFNNKALELFRETTKKENKQIMSVLTLKYESEKKDKEIALNNVKIADLRTKILISMFFLLLALLGYFVLRKYNRIKIKGLNDIKQREIIEANLIGEEREKERVSYELHDSISASLTMLNYQLEEVNRTNKMEQINLIIDKIKNVQQETRKISHNLLPFQEGQNLSQSMNIYCIENSSDQFKIHFFSLGQFDSLPVMKAKTLYRVVQELIHNSLKYANTKDCFVNLIEQNNEINVSVEDGGVGFDLNDEAKKGQGIASVKSRIFALGGKCSIESNISKGTQIMISLPN